MPKGLLRLLLIKLLMQVHMDLSHRIRSRKPVWIWRLLLLTNPPLLRLTLSQLLPTYRLLMPFLFLLICGAYFISPSILEQHHADKSSLNHETNTILLSFICQAFCCLSLTISNIPFLPWAHFHLQGSRLSLHLFFFIFTFSSFHIHCSPLLCIHVLPIFIHAV